jgi:putative membrane protein
VNTQFTDQEISEGELKQVQQSLIYRHIAWLYTLRSMLLVPTSWEHISQNKHIAKHAKKNMLKYGIGSIEDEDINDLIKNLLPHDELNYLKYKKNPATQLIDLQSQELSALRKKGLIDDFRHVEMQKALNDFYIFQGKCERIKKFPLPRQYGSMSFIFVGIFIFLLPFGMVSEFSKLGEWGIWLSIPSSILVGWVYLVMELVGDYSENPFEGLANDIPMLSLCRTIEIDLREMLQEKNIPKPIEVKNGVLM